MSSNENVQNWSDLAIGLYDKLTGRGARIDYEFDSFSVGVPQDSGDSSPVATWKLDGTVRISTQDQATPGR